MNILIIGQLPPPVHGSNVMTERFVNALKTNGFDSTIVQKSFSQSMPEVGRASLKKIFKIPTLYRQVSAAIKEQRPSLSIYFLTVGVNSLLVDCLILTLLRKNKIPYVLYFHGKGYRKYEATSYFFMRGIVRNALKKAFGGIVLGEQLKQDVNHCILDENLYILPNGIPPSELSGLDGRNKPNGTTRICFLSNLIPTKGPLRFLEMAKRVREKAPFVQFIMAGGHITEAYLDELKQFIAIEKLQDCVMLPGPVYGQAKQQLWENTDIFVYPTEKDVFPLVIVEAMQHGIPVISSPIGAIQDAVCDGVNGFIVEPYDIESLTERAFRLVHDDKLRKSMGEAGKKLYERHYSLNAYYSNTRKALEYFLSRLDLSS